MLHAIINNKAGRIHVNGEAVPIRQVYREREDMITAAVFSRLSYLSGEVQKLLFESILLSPGIDFSQLLRVEFWPRFSSTVQSMVEPDVVLHFDWGVVVVEVKRPLDGMQNAEQWYRELEALPDEYCEGKVFFWAIGGNEANNQQQITKLERLLDEDERVPDDVKIFATDWSKFGGVLDRLNDTDVLNSKADKNVLEDIMASLDLYNVQYRKVKFVDFYVESLRCIGGAEALKYWFCLEEDEFPQQKIKYGFDDWPVWWSIDGVSGDLWQQWSDVSKTNQSLDVICSWAGVENFELSKIHNIDTISMLGAES